MKNFADKVIYGNFYTVDKKNPKAEAVAVADGVFIYVGDADGVKKFICAGTTEERYTNGIILPGFGDGHGHVASGTTTLLFQANLFAGKNLEDYRAVIKAYAETHPEFEIILGMGFMPNFAPNGPTADMLEGLTDKCVVVSDAGGHSYWVNHAVMKKLGIDRNTPDVSDGIIVRDAAGNPTGWFREGAMSLIKPLAAYSVEQYKEAILHYQKKYLAHGQTIFLDPITNWDNTDNATEAYHQLDAEGKLKMHAYGAFQVLQAAGHDTMAEIEHAAELREKTKGRMFDLSNIKVFVDGVVGGTPPTACVKEPYADAWSQENNYRGQLRFDLETLTAVYKKSHELGFTVHVHALGDGALSFTLDAIEKALAQTGTHDFRDAVTHLQVVDKTDIPRMKKLGVVACADPFWFVMDEEYFNMTVEILGEARAENQLPMKSFFDAGVVVSSASDYPVENPTYPLIGIQKGVLRQNPNQPETLHAPAERVTVEQMIEASTLNEAYQLKCEDKLGSITVGKEADLVVLDDDITTCAAEKISDTKILRTMVGGEWVYIS